MLRGGLSPRRSTAPRRRRSSTGSHAGGGGRGTAGVREARCQWCTAPLPSGRALCRYAGGARRRPAGGPRVHRGGAATPAQLPACAVPMQSLDLRLGGTSHRALRDGASRCSLTRTRSRRSSSSRPLPSSRSTTPGWTRSGAERGARPGALLPLPGLPHREGPRQLRRPQRRHRRPVSEARDVARGRRAAAAARWRRRGGRAPRLGAGRRSASQRSRRWSGGAPKRTPRGRAGADGCAGPPAAARGLAAGASRPRGGVRDFVTGRRARALQRSSLAPCPRSGQPPA